MSKRNVTQIKVRDDLVADALRPIEEKVTRIEQRDAQKEVDRLVADHGPKR